MSLMEARDGDQRGWQDPLDRPGPWLTTTAKVTRARGVQLGEL